VKWLVAGVVAVAVCLAVASVAAASFPGRNGRLVYSSPSGISTMRADGTHRRLLSSLPGATQPAWGPAGRRIAFAAREGSDGSWYEIYVMRADGQNVRQVTSNGLGDVSPSWSPTGKRVAVVRTFYDQYGDPIQDTAELRIIRLDGGTARVLVRGQVLEAKWSPNGKLIAYSTGNAVYVVSPAGGTPMLVANLPTDDYAADLEWQTPGPYEQGGAVLFTRYSGGPCDEICTDGVWAVSNVETAYFGPGAYDPPLERLTPWRTPSARKAVWSPDQRRILYCQPADGWPITFDLASMRWDGTGAHKVAHAPCASDWQPLPAERSRPG
jgi:Tol biopolymer transport system component